MDVSILRKGISIDPGIDTKRLKEFIYISHCKMFQPTDNSTSRFDYVGSKSETHFTGSSICFGCACEGNCSDEDCCVCIAQYGRNFDSQRRLVKLSCNVSEESVSLPIFECNSCCSCNIECVNRVVQKGITTKLQIYLSPVKGLGLRTLEYVPRGTFVMEYVGEIIPFSEAKRRANLLKPGDSNYLLTTKEHVANGRTIRTDIDASDYGNEARFINHSCDPNLILVPARIDSTIPRIALFSGRDIHPLEELFFDYSGKILFQSEKVSSYFQESEATNSSRKKCECGAPNCRGLLPFEHSLFSS